MHDFVLAAVLHVAGCPAGQDLCPGKGSIPSGVFGTDLARILGWVAWIATAACVVGILSVGATMAVQHQRGRTSEHMTGLLWVLVGCILIGAGSSLVGMFA